MEKLNSDKVVLTRLIAILGVSPREVIYNTLEHLVKLNLSSLGIEHLPVEIGQLTSLQELDLYINQLSQLPAEIGQLTSLQTLSLHDNHLSQLPAEIWQLINLQGLTLNNNQLSQLPAEIGQLTNLQNLSLDGNSSLLTPPPEIVAQGTLGSYLHDLGKILFFRDDPLLSRMIILKPNWITKAISRVLKDEPTKDDQGILVLLSRFE